MLPNRAGDCDVLSYSQLPLNTTKTRHCALVCTRPHVRGASRSSHFCVILLNSYQKSIIKQFVIFLRKRDACTREKQASLLSFSRGMVHSLVVKRSLDRSQSGAYEAMPFSSVSSSSERVSAAPVTLSRRCATDEVPGISRMFGERCNSHASATAIGVASRRVATDISVSDCSGEKPPSGK